jgi:hypothetical protein
MPLGLMKIDADIRMSDFPPAARAPPILESSHGQESKEK